MAEKKPKKKVEKVEKEELVEEKEEVKKKVIVPPPPPMPKAKPMLVSFDKWFLARSKVRGWKPHWKNGLKAYTNTSGRRTVKDWDLLFEKY